MRGEVHDHEKRGRHRGSILLERRVSDEGLRVERRERLLRDRRHRRGGGRNRLAGEASARLVRGGAFSSGDRRVGHVHVHVYVHELTAIGTVGDVDEYTFDESTYVREYETHSVSIL
jgi:hypothetical protein